MNYQRFTSESVSKGHPDKLADQVSDAILDACLDQDPNARVACEVMVKTGVCILSGEISTTAVVDYEKVARDAIWMAGYNNPAYGYDGESVGIINIIGQQSPEIEAATNQNNLNQGAGDQGMMFGFATNELTERLMPSAITFAHDIISKLERDRESENVEWLRPDAKAQVTLLFGPTGKPEAVDTILVSTQHDPHVSGVQIAEYVRDWVVPHVFIGVHADLIRPETKIITNPSGRFVVGGPVGDCGLTGRKIIVDTYGGAAHHGGGAFSGKDPTKVDRSAAYAARWVAKNLVAAGVVAKCEVQLSYAIGLADPVSVAIDTFGTGITSSDAIEDIVKGVFDLRPGAIIRDLDLLKPIYGITASGGHFGRVPVSGTFPWEETNRVADIISEGNRLGAF